jgi:acyl-CoA thioesterase I
MQRGRFVCAGYYEVQMIVIILLRLKPAKFMRRSLNRLCLVIGILISSYVCYAQIKVACVGNSITEGWGLDKDKEAYPVILQQKLGSNYVVRNYGLSNRTMLRNGDDPYSKEEAYGHVLAWEPNIVIIKLGTNDSKPENWNEHKGEFYRDYVDFVNSFKALSSKPKIYICLPVPVFESKDEFDEEWGITENIVKTGVLPLVKKAAQHTKCEIINLYAAFYGKDNSNQTEDGQLMSLDGVHPTAKGAALIAEEVFKAITK